MLRMATLILCLFFAALEGLSQVTTTYGEAKHAYELKHFRMAAQLFAKVANSGRDHPASRRTDALLMQARSLANLGDFGAAERVIRAYIGQDARSYQGLYLLGYVLERENKPKESLELFTRAAAISAPRPEDLRLVALDYVLLDDYSDAIKWLSHAVGTDPSNTEAWYDLGRAQMHVGNFGEAERDFGRVIALNPRESRALNNLGLSYEAQNRPDEALAAYLRAIDAQKESRHPSEQPLLNLGAFLNTRMRFDEAIAPLRKAVALSPSNSRCHEELSKAYVGTHHDDLAREQMERAVSLEPKSPSLHYELSQIYRRAGLAERAKTELKMSSDLYGTSSATMEEGQRSGSSPAIPK